MVVAVLALAAGACGDDGDSDDDETATTTEPSEVTTTTVPVEQEVEEAYLAYWDMLDRLAQNPDPDDPEIQERASGEALEELMDFVTTMQASGWRGEFGKQHSHEVLSVDVESNEAVVTHCAVDDSRVIDTTTGEVVREGVAPRVYEATLERTNAGWQIHNVTEVEPWPDAGECA